MCIIPRRKSCRRHKDPPKTARTVHCPYQSSEPQNSPIPPHYISKRTKATKSTKYTKDSQPQPSATSTMVTEMYASHLPPWIALPTPTPRHTPYPGWTQIPQPNLQTYTQYGVYPLWPGLPTQPPAQLARPPPRTKSSLLLAEKADAASQKLEEEQTEQEDAKLLRQIDSRIKFGDELRLRIYPAPSASEATKRVEDEKRRRDEEDLQHFRAEDEDRKPSQRIQAGLSPIDATVKSLMKAEEDRQLQERIEKAASQGKLGGLVEGRAGAIREEEERYHLATARRRHSRLRNRSQSSGSDSERSRIRSQHRTGGRKYGGGEGSRGTHGSGRRGFGNGFHDPQTLLPIGAAIAMSYSPRASGYTSQPLIAPPSNYNAFQQNQAVSYAGGRRYPYYYEDVVLASQFESTARSISDKLDQFGQGQQRVLDRLDRVDTHLSQGHKRMMNRFGYMGRTLENLSQRFLNVGI